MSVQPYSGWREKVYLTPGCLALLLVSGSQALTHSSPIKCHISSINAVYQIYLKFASFGKIQFKILSLCLSSLLWLLIHSFCTRQMFRLAQIFSSSTEFCLVLDGNRSNLAVPSSLLRIQTQVKKALELSRSLRENFVVMSNIETLKN